MTTGPYILVVFTIAFALVAGGILTFRTYAVEALLRRRLNRASWWFREHGTSIAPLAVAVPLMREAGILMLVIGITTGLASVFELLN